MVILQEKNPEKSTNSILLKTTAQKLDEISSLLGQLSQKMAIMVFSKGYLKQEGTSADRLFVKNTIEHLQELILDLDKVVFLFRQDDLTVPVSDLQQSLDKAAINIKAIRGDMLSIWSMRSSGETPEDNQIIISLIERLFARVNGLLGKIRIYVLNYNRNSAIKLIFNIRWTALPK